MRRPVVLLCLVVPVVLAAAPKKPEIQIDREAAADAHDKIICKRFANIGSLVATRKECKTKRDWERERAAMREATGMGGTCNTTSGNC